MRKTYSNKKRKLSGWKCRLQTNYKSFEEFEAYNETYGLARRLGYSSAKAAWAANPMVHGSVIPSDYGKVAEKGPKILRLFLYDDGSDDNILILDEGQDFNYLLSTWNKMDREFCDTGVEPEGYLPLSKWLKVQGVTVIDPIEKNLTAKEYNNELA